MANGATIHARIDAKTKHEAQNVLSALGLSMSEAISLFFRQIVLRQAIPFEIKIPNDVTAATLRKSTQGRELHKVSDVKDLMKALSE